MQQAKIARRSTGKLLALLADFTCFLTKDFARPALFFGLQKHHALLVHGKPGNCCVSRPGKVGPTNLGRHAPSHRFVTLQHLARYRPFASLRKDFAKRFVARIQQIAYPPGTRSLAPESKPQRCRPLLDRGPTGDLDTNRRKLEFT